VLIQHTRYTSDDKEFREFLFKMLSFLEPRWENAGTVLMQENQEVYEVLFFQQGTFLMGYELNQVSTYVIK